MSGQFQVTLEFTQLCGPELGEGDPALPSELPGPPVGEEMQGLVLQAPWCPVSDSSVVSRAEAQGPWMKDSWADSHAVSHQPQ